MTDPAAIARAEERAAIVAWLRSQGATWERLSRRSDARGSEYADIAHSQAGIAASYQDHADAIEQGRHLLNAAAGRGD